MADFKEHSPIEEEPRMPERESSLDDFEKLENFCIQDKTDDLLPQDILLGSISNEDKTNKPNIEIRDAVEDLLGMGDNYGSRKSNVDELSRLVDFSTDSGEFKIEDKGRQQQHRETGESPFFPPPYEEPAAADYTVDHVVEATERLLQFEEDNPRQFFETAKLVHPQSDSGYVPSPEAEEEKKVILPSSPKIDEALLETADRKEKASQEQLTGPKVNSESKGQQKKSPTMATDDTKTNASAGGCPFSFSALFDPNRLNPYVTNLVYWRDPKKSGIVFGVSLLFLLSLRYFSFITVVSYLALAVISVTLSFRIYKNILQAVQKSSDGHPFKEYLEQDVSIPQETVHEAAEKIVDHIKSTVLKLRSLFLVEDLIDSIKLGIVLWCLTYLGAWFNGLTLITLGFIAAFSLPKVYETNKAQIDQYIGLVSTQVSGVVQTVKSKIPFGPKEKAQ